MAVLKINLYSYVLGKDTNVEMLLPERRHRPHKDIRGVRYPVVYFLNGHSADESAWMRHSTMEFMLSNTDIAAVMPDCHRGYFADSANGYQYFTYLTEELPLILKNWFPLSDRREDTSVAGYSMGAYGALKCALRRPDLYSRCLSMSSEIYFDDYIEGHGKELEITAEDGAVYYNPVYQLNDFYSNVRNYMGRTIEEFNGSINDLEAAVKDLIKSGAPLPKIYMCCANQDALHLKNKRFYQFIKENAPQLDCVYEVGEGRHNWDFWSRELRRGLQMLDILQ